MTAAAAFLGGDPLAIWKGINVSVYRINLN